MILVWSSEGGPLQYVGLAIGAIQFLLPLLHNLSEYDGAGVIFLAGLATAATLGIACCIADGITTTTMTQWLTPSRLLLVAGVMLPLPLAFFLGQTHSAGATAALALASHAAMALAACSALRDVMGRAATYPAHRRRTEPRKMTVEEIAALVRKIPVEEFVSEEELEDNCSIARLKRMLNHRGVNNPEERCVERTDLVRELLRVRKFHSECAICAESYQEGDPMRVLPCQHEFHLHCFDRWVYTFSTDSRPNTKPTCPLCKATID